MKNKRKGLWYASIAGTFAAAIALGVTLSGPSFAQGSSGSSGSAASDSSGQSDGAAGSSGSSGGSAAQDSSGQSDGSSGGSTSGQASGENESTRPGSGTTQTERMGEPGSTGSSGATGSAGATAPSTGMQSAMTAEELQGKNVMTSRGEDLGAVEDVVIEQGQVKAALVDVGGFLGLGAKRVAIPQERLSVQGDAIQTTMTEDEIAALPEYEEGQGVSGGTSGTMGTTGSGQTR